MTTGLKDLRNRIRGVYSMEKMTSAMKMVSSVKLRRAQAKLSSMRDYAQSHETLLNLVLNQDGYETVFCGLGKGPLNLILVIMPDRGLCGSYSGNIYKTLQKHTTFSYTDVFVFIGHKGREKLPPHQVWDRYTFSERSAFSFQSAHDLARTILTAYRENILKSVRIVSGRFRNAISQSVECKTLLPYKANLLDSPPYLLQEEEKASFLEALFLETLTAQIYLHTLESIACEQGARMTAMDTATRNAKDRLDALQILYNQTRQAKITNELMEVISGAGIF